MHNVFAAQFGGEGSRLWTSDGNGGITPWSLSRDQRWHADRAKPAEDIYKDKTGTSPPQLAVAGDRWLVLTKRNEKGVASSTAFDVTHLRKHYSNDESNILAISPNGRWLVTTDPKGVGILDLASARPGPSPYTLIPRPDIPPTAAVFSPDGERFAISQPSLPIQVYQTAAWDEQIKRDPKGGLFKFDVVEDSAIQTEVVLLAISVDGRWLMSSGKDGSVYVFDMTENSLALRLPVYRSEGVVVLGVFQTGIDKARSSLVTVTDRGVTRKWRIDLLDPKNFGSVRDELLLRAGRHVVGRNFHCNEWKAIFWRMPFEPTFPNREPNSCDARVVNDYAR